MGGRCPLPELAPRFFQSRGSARGRPSTACYARFQMDGRDDFALLEAWRAGDAEDLQLTAWSLAFRCPLSGAPRSYSLPHGLVPSVGTTG